MGAFFVMPLKQGALPCRFKKDTHAQKNPQSKSTRF